MDCPHCHENLLTKDYEHLSVSTCKNCQGLWLSPEQLSQIITIQEQFSPEEIQKVLRAAHAGVTDSEAASNLSCPVCAKKMAVINYDYSSGIILHVCPNGDGLWFDKDELEDVQIFMEHWDAEGNRQKAKLLSSLKVVRDDEAANPNNKYIEASDESNLKLTLTDILDPLFKLFDHLRL